ncbi:hypothetical protein HUU51_01825 [Candidatus Gracilibacteria bacterium]|nr:hypothetical protein [Candidatus Gracilibacteria bacterium]
MNKGIDGVQYIPGNLDSIYKNYTGLEKQFGKAIWEQIKTYFPKGFNRNLLRLSDILPEIVWSGIVGTQKSVAKISKADYKIGELSELYSQIKPINGLIIDGFKIELEFDETNENPQIIIKYIKLTKEQLKEIGRDASVVSSVEKIIDKK